MAKNSSLPVTSLENKAPLKVLHGTKLILDDHMDNLDSFKISLESFSEVPYSSNWSGTIFCCFLQQTSSSQIFVWFYITWQGLSWKFETVGAANP